MTIGFVVSWFRPLHLWDIEMPIGFIFSSSENVIQVVGGTVFQYQWQGEWLKLIIALMRATSHQHFRTLAKFRFQIKWFDHEIFKYFRRSFQPNLHCLNQELGTVSVHLPVHFQCPPSYYQCPGVRTGDHRSSWHHNLNNS